MKILSSPAAFICIITVICSVINLVAPSEKMQKSAKLALSLFFICSLISPVKSLIDTVSGSLDFSYEESARQETVSIDYNEMILSQTVKNVNEAAQLLLSENGIENAKAEFSAHITENNSIKLDSVNIYMNSVTTSQIMKIKSVIIKNFGLSPIITAGNTNGTEN